MSTYDSSPDISIEQHKHITAASSPCKHEVSWKSMKRMEKKYKIAMRKVNHMMHAQNKQICQVRNYSVQISDLNTQIVELKRRLEETEVKNREMSANINQLKIDATIMSPTTSSSSVIRGSSNTRNIKPRTATIILKRRIAESAATASTMKKTKLI
jgi:F-box protein 28